MAVSDSCHRRRCGNLSRSGPSGQDIFVPMPATAQSSQNSAFEVLASLAELDFAWAALITAAMANVFAAFKVSQRRMLVLGSLTHPPITPLASSPHPRHAKSRAGVQD